MPPGAGAVDGFAGYQAQLPVGVEVANQADERLGVTAVGGGGDQQQVAGALGQSANEAVAFVAPLHAAGQVSFVDDDQVPGLGQHLVAVFGALGEVDAGDQAFVDLPGILARGQLAEQLRPENVEAKVEEAAEGLGPVFFEVGRGEHQDAAGKTPQQQLLDDQAGLDGLTQAHVVGDQQADPRRRFQRH